MANGDEKPPEEQNFFENLRDSAAKVIEVAGDAAGAVAESAGDIYDAALAGGVAGALLQASIEKEELFQKAVEAFAEAGVKNLSSEEEEKTLQNSINARGSDQCYLAYHMKPLSDLHVQTIIDYNALSDFAGDEGDIVNQAANDLLATEFSRFPQFKYKNSHLLDTPKGQIAEVVPKLFLRPDTLALLDATTAELSNLVPMVKIYKTVYDDDNTTYEVPFKFYNHTVNKDNAREDWYQFDSFEKTPAAGVQARSAVGIKSFDWQYISGNPDTVKKDITAKLVLFFQSMDELIRLRNYSVRDSNGQQKDVQYSYLDLVVNPARRQPSSTPESINQDTSQSEGRGKPEGAFDQFDPSEYEIKASVGWASGKNNVKEISEELKNAIDNTKTNLFLSLTDHEFSFNQDGSFELQISYRSRLEGILESPKSNILFCDKKLMNESAAFKLLIQYEEEIEKLGGQKCADNKKQLEDTKRKLVNIQDSLRLETYKFIILNMLRPERWLGYEPVRDSAPESDMPQRLIYSMLVDPIGFGEFSDVGVMPENLKILDYESVTTRELVFKKPDWVHPSSEANISGDKLIYRPANPDEMIINFFYLGDLVEMLMTTVFDTEKYDSIPDSIRKKYSFNRAEIEKLRLLMGPMQFTDPRTGNIETINIADIPVGLRAFTDFFHRKVIKQQLTVYNFKSFLKDLMHDLVITALGKECFEDIQQTNGRLRSTYLTAPALSDGSDPVVAKGDKFAVTTRVDMDTINNDNPLFNYGSPKPLQLSEHYHYVVLHMQSKAGLVYPGIPGGPQLEKREGVEQTPKEQDLDRGIKHLIIGRDRGLLLNVNFSKTNEPFLRQARLENSGRFNPILQLSDVYEVDVEMMGNTFFYPGTQFYLNPFGLGYTESFGVPHNRGSLSNIMGLGGYHTIINVSSYIESGVYKTSFKARFETNGDGFSDNDSVKADSGGDCPEDSS